MKNTTSVFLIVFTACALGAGAYWYFFINTGTEAPVSSIGTLNPTQAQFQTLIAELQPISFNTGILSDPRFLSLTDLSIPIAPEALGHIDPFAPGSHAH